MQAKTAFIETYGCSANAADSHALESYLEENGYKVVESPEQASLVVVNTCSVKNHTEAKIVTRLKELRRLEERGTKTVVTGCLVAGNRQKLAQIVPEERLVKNRDFEGFRKLLGLEEFDAVKARPGLKTLDANRTAVLRVSEGCLSNCTFCSTKLARGNTKSYSTARLVQEARESVARGALEAYMSSEDTGAFGLDRGEDLLQLMRALSDVEGDLKVRLGMMNPDTFYRFNRLSENRKYWKEFAALLKGERFYKFVHLPVQSGSDRVLKDMNRLYTREQFTKLVEFLREEVPGIAVSTDFIVGFPTEAEADFQESLELADKYCFDFFNLSKFSPRPNTKAFELKQLPGEIVKGRGKALMEKLREKSLEINEGLVGKTIAATVTGKAPRGGWIARLESNRQVIIPQGVVGEKTLVRVEKAHPTYLEGSAVLGEEKGLKQSQRLG